MTTGLRYYNLKGVYVFSYFNMFYLVFGVTCLKQTKLSVSLYKLYDVYIKPFPPLCY